MGRATEALRRFRDRLVTADAVYGTILFAALVGVAGDEEEGEQVDGLIVEFGTDGVDQQGSLEVLVIAVASLLVFWAAHVYARTIANHGVRGQTEVPLGQAFRRALSASNGMLTAAVPSVIVLLLGAAGVIPDAADWALLVAVVVLFVLGWQAFAERRRRVIWRFLGGLVSALLGFLLVLLNAIVH